MTTRTITIAHLSDVHLGPIVGFAPRYWNAKRASGYLNWIKNRRHAYRRDVLDRIVSDLKAQTLDHILVSGDLCNVGLPAEMDAALTWLESLGPAANVAVVPGNHDIYSGLHGDAGVARWAAYMQGDARYDYGTTTPNRASGWELPSAFPYVRRLGHVALIGLNSAIETAPFIAAGEIGADQLSRFAAILDETGEQGLVRVVMLHHAPLPGQTRSSHALKDAAALKAVLETHGAELVLHGHLHRPVKAVLARRQGRGTVTVIGVASASLGVVHPHEPLARYNLLSIEPERLVVETRGLARPDGPIEALDRLTIPLPSLHVAPHSD